MLSNYTIKQALPRLIMAAIFINLSYWICALMVDASNLLGQSIFALLKGLAGNAVGGSSIIAITEVIMAGSMVGGAVVAGAAGTALTAILVPTVGPQLLMGLAMLFGSLVLGIALAILTAFLILAARQALIILLVVVSPIAFALYILPGTKSLFDKWRKLLTTMLVFFPLFSLLYGVAQIAGSVLIAYSGQLKGPVDQLMLSGAFLFMGITAQFAPLFLSPWLLKNSTGILGQLGSKFQQRGKALTDMPGRAGRKKLGEAWDTTKKAAGHKFREATARRGDRRAAQGKSRGAMESLAFSNDRREAYHAALDEEKKQQGAEYGERNDFTREHLNRASTAKDNTIAATERREGARLGLGTEAAEARAAKLTAEKDKKAAENRVNTAHLGSREGRQALAELQATEDEDKEAENDAKMAALGNAGNVAARQARLASEDELKSKENETDAAGLRANTAGRQAAERLRVNSEKNLKTAENESEINRLGTAAGKAADHALDASTTEAKAAELEVKTAGQALGTAGAAAHERLESAEIDKKISDDQLKIHHLANNQSEHLDAAASAAQLENAQADQRRVETELTTDQGYATYTSTAGANVTAAQGLRDAARTKSAIADVTAGAQRVAVTEEAAAISSGAIPAASHASSVDRYGAQRAVAKAENIIEQQLMDGMKIERSSLGSMNDKVLIRRAETGMDEQGRPLSNEAQMAVASEISNRGYAQNHIDLFRTLNNRMAAAAQPHYTTARATIQRSAYPAGPDGTKQYDAAIETYVDDALSTDPNLDGLRYMQKQALADIGNQAPFAVGDQMRGDMGRGVSRRNFDADWADRLTKKLKAPTIQGWKSEDFKWIEENINNNTLTAAHKQALQDGVNDILNSPDATANTKKEIKQFFDKLRANNHIQRSFVDLPPTP